MSGIVRPACPRSHIRLPPSVSALVGSFQSVRRVAVPLVVRTRATAVTQWLDPLLGQSCDAGAQVTARRRGPTEANPSRRYRCPLPPRTQASCLGLPSRHRRRRRRSHGARTALAMHRKMQATGSPKAKARRARLPRAQKASQEMAEASAAVRALIAPCQQPKSLLMAAIRLLRVPARKKALAAI